jgi:hypothetical protein
MKHEITPFNYNGNSLSTITDEQGEVWFIAKEVCAVLEIQNVTQAVANLDEDERSMFKIGRQGNVNIINESGLYSLTLNSRKPEAKSFKKWVTSEVLPAIRKTGKYESIAKPSDKPVLPAKIFPDYFRIARLIGCDRNAAAISANNAVFKKTGENILQLLGHSAIETETQQLYFNVSDLVDGISGVRMNKMLEAAGLQHKEGERWMPDDDGKFSRILDTGKRHGDGSPVQQVKWSRDVLAMLSLDQAA